MATRAAPVTTRAALLQALREGPGYGLDLIRRVERMTQGRVRLAEARVYPLLDRLRSERLVDASPVSPGGRRGARLRTFYELTPRGVEASNAVRQILASLVAGGRPARAPSRRERVRMAERLLEAEELAEAGEALRSARRVRVGS